MADQIPPAELFGIANAPERRDTIGGLDPRVRIAFSIGRKSSDWSITEIEIAAVDRPEQEELDVLNLEAELYPLGPEESWRSRMAGKHTCGAGHHPQRGIDFEDRRSDGR